MPNDTELHRAANQGEYDEVAALLEGGAEVDARGAQGRTALHRALGAGETATAKLLIEHNADPRIVDLQQRTSLHWAALAPSAPGNLECCELLFDCGVADEMLSCQSESKSTPLHFAFFASNEGVARLLLSKGADLTIVDEDNKTPVALAKEKGMSGLLKKK